eukprot:8593719-Lingulodinium_polyedra.AAC.1
MLRVLRGYWAGAARALRGGAWVLRGRCSGVVSARPASPNQWPQTWARTNEDATRIHRALALH